MMQLDSFCLCLPCHYMYQYLRASFTVGDDFTHLVFSCVLHLLCDYAIVFVHDNIPSLREQKLLRQRSVRQRRSWGRACDQFDDTSARRPRASLSGKHELWKMTKVRLLLCTTVVCAVWCTIRSIRCGHVPCCGGILIGGCTIMVVGGITIIDAQYCPIVIESPRYHLGNTDDCECDWNIV